MRRTLLAVMLAALATVASTVGALAQTGPAVTITPGEGNQFQDYTLRGTGYAPGQRLDIAFADPDGTVFSLQINGQPAVMVADSNGGFELQILPATDLKGARAGVWGGAVCPAGTDNCLRGPFKIDP